MKTIYAIIFSFSMLICSFKSFAQTPGNVSSDLKWWFKANSGTSTTTDGDQLDTWTNQASFTTTTVSRATPSTSGHPMYKSNVINFNPAIRFLSTNPSALMTPYTGVFATDQVNTQPTADNSTCIIVFKSTQNFTGSNLQWQSPNLISTERYTTGQDFSIGFHAGKIAMECHDNFDEWSAYNNNTYNTGSPQIATLTREKDGISVFNPSIVHFYMNALSDINATSVASSFTLNSSDYTPDSSYAGFQIGAQVTRNLLGLNTNTGFDGDIAEVIVYNSVQNASDLKKIQSYLAIKYGISLDQSIAYDYQRSDGTVIWDAAAFGAYRKDIAGIGRDDDSGLNQTTSQSVNAGAMVLMTSPAAMSNNEFLLWSDEGTSVVNNRENNDGPAGIQGRLNRVWRTQETGDIGTVTVSVDLTNVSGALNLSDLKLIVDDDGTFASGTTTTYNASSLSNRVVTFTLVDFDNTNQRFFTIGSTNISSTPLPVDFISFRTKNCDEVEWEVANESNIEKYNVLTSVDLLNWKLISNIYPQQNSSVYNVTIPKATSLTYIKIEGVENSKLFNSVIIPVYPCVKEIFFKTYPLPCHSYFNIEIDEEIETLEIFDALGKSIEHISVSKYEAGYRLNTSHLNSGMYWCNFKTKNSHQFTCKICVIE